MMRMLVIAGAAALALSSAAWSKGDVRVEEGFERGALAVAAIDRGDWQAAETLLEARRGVDAEDPARLINLGRVYLATGRPGMALSAWRRAEASPRAYQVATADGRWLSTRAIAAEALARYAPAERSASR